MGRDDLCREGYKQQLVAELLTTITVEQVNAVAKLFTLGSNSVVIVTEPEMATADCCTEEALKAALGAAMLQEDLDPWVESEGRTSFLPEGVTPTSGSVVSRQVFSTSPLAETTESAGACLCAWWWWWL